ncbi:hypothetical protein WMY93_000634 [Mugilogobius chulae]|uniref:C-type lectin domain-containing protein n=1 Tax=Mugilogobius chulae TaxID=88201 RepID=A0AAW0Q1H4_9GOBI
MSLALATWVVKYPSHTSSPPFTVGNTREVERPAPLKELSFRPQAAHRGQLCLSVCQDHKYTFISEPKSWTEAQQFCRTYYTDLATVNHMSDLQALRAAAVGQPDAWIGLYLTSENQVDRKFYWSQPDIPYETPPAGTWWLGRPASKNSLDALSHCGVLTTKNLWYDTTCPEPEGGFACYNKTSNDVFKSGLYKSWLGAQLYCRTYHTDLLSGLTQQKMYEAKYPTRTYSHWTGLFRDNWGWSDGSTSSFRNMKTEVSPQTKKCAALTSDGRWDHVDCGLQKPFVCHGDFKTQTTTAQIALSSAVDPNAFESLILKQLYEHLTAMNLTIYNLKWKRGKDARFSKNKRLQSNRRGPSRLNLHLNVQAITSGHRIFV